MQTIQPPIRSGAAWITHAAPELVRESEARSRTVVGLHILLGDFSGGLRNLAKNLVHLLQLGGPIVLGAVVCLLRGTIPLVDKGADLGVEVLQLLADALGIVGNVGGQRVHHLRTNGNRRHDDNP